MRPPTAPARPATTTTSSAGSCGRTVEVEGRAVESWADRVGAGARLRRRRAHRRGVRHLPEPAPAEAAFALPGAPAYGRGEPLAIRPRGSCVVPVRLAIGLLLAVAGLVAGSLLSAPPGRRRHLLRPAAGGPPRRLGAGTGEHLPGVRQGAGCRRTAAGARRALHQRRRARPHARRDRRPHHQRHRRGVGAHPGPDPGAGRRQLVRQAVPRHPGADPVRHPEAGQEQERQRDGGAEDPAHRDADDPVPGPGARGCRWAGTSS